MSRKLQCGKALNAPPPHLDTIIVTTFSNNNKIIFNPNYIKGGGMCHATQKLATLVNPPPPECASFLRNLKRLLVTNVPFGITHCDKRALECEFMCQLFS